MSNNDILKIKLDNIHKEVSATVDLLKCCGNCAHTTMPSECSLKMQDKYIYFLPFKCCEQWSYDGLQREERNI